VILLNGLKFLRDLRMLATILILLCHNQDSVAIHTNCRNQILDLTLENFPSQFVVINIWNALLYSVFQCNTLSTFKCHLDLYLKNGISISFRLFSLTAVNFRLIGSQFSQPHEPDS